MGYDLYNKKGSFRFSISMFPPMLQLAERYGWQPEGTQEPRWYDCETGELLYPERVGQWDGNYWSNDGQSVTDTDAAGIADALERALPDIPEHRTHPSIICTTWQELTDETLAEIKAQHENEYGRATPVTVMRLSEFTIDAEAPTVLVKNNNEEYNPSPIDIFSGTSGRQRVQDFIEFCRGGGFGIH